MTAPHAEYHPTSSPVCPCQCLCDCLGVCTAPGVRTLARLKRTSSQTERKVEIDGGLDVPLVTMLLTAVDQLLISHEAIDYDVAWPDDYGFWQGECLSSRKKEADELKSRSDLSTQTGDDYVYDKTRGRSCFCF